MRAFASGGLLDWKKLEMESPADAELELAEVVGHLAGLRRFPVRPLGGETPDECLVAGKGLAGDRIYDLVDVESGAPLSERQTPSLLRYRVRYVDSLVRGERPRGVDAGADAGRR